MTPDPPWALWIPLVSTLCGVVVGVLAKAIADRIVEDRMKAGRRHARAPHW